MDLSEHFCPPVHICAYHCQCLLTEQLCLLASNLYDPTISEYQYKTLLSFDKLKCKLHSAFWYVKYSSVLPWAWQWPSFGLVIALNTIPLKKQPWETTQEKSSYPLSLLYNSAEWPGHSHHHKDPPGRALLFYPVLLSFRLWTPRGLSYHCPSGFRTMLKQQALVHQYMESAFHFKMKTKACY